MNVLEKPNAELGRTKLPAQFRKRFDVQGTPMFSQLRLLRDRGAVFPALIDKAAHTIGGSLASKAFSESEMLVNKDTCINRFMMSCSLGNHAIEVRLLGRLSTDGEQERVSGPLSAFAILEVAEVVQRGYHIDKIAARPQFLVTSIREHVRSEQLQLASLVLYGFVTVQYGEAVDPS